MRMDARRTTKVVVRTTTEEGGAAGAAFSRQPFGTGLAGALALSLGSQISHDIFFALLRAIIPGKLPVAPARELFRGSLEELLADRLAGQAMIGASAAPMRSRCAVVIKPFSKLLNRGICTPDTMYCQRYAASTVALTASTSSAEIGRPQTSTK